MDSKDEMKVYSCEGGEKEDDSSDEALKEDKRELVTEGSDIEDNPHEGSSRHIFNLSGPPSRICSPWPDKYSIPFSPSPFGYPYPPPFAAPLPHFPLVNRVPLIPPNHAPSPLSLMMDPFHPPPAHMGIHFPLKNGMVRPPMYPLATSPIPPHMFNPEFMHPFPWSHHSSIYSHLRSSPFPPAVPLSHANFMHKFPPPVSLPSHKVIPTILPPLTPRPDHEPLAEDRNKYRASPHTVPPVEPLSRYYFGDLPLPKRENQQPGSPNVRKKETAPGNSHIKKPLNAFMLFMRERRPQVIAESTLKESAQINQILGKQWHELGAEQQAKYYNMAKQEREDHLQRYPGWTARDNYALNAKKKKKKRDKVQDADGNQPKKCRARYGLDQQSQWCKPCRRKKKCIRYRDTDQDGETTDDNNINSVGSFEPPTPDSPYDANSPNFTELGERSPIIVTNGPPMCKSPFNDDVKLHFSEESGPEEPNYDSGYDAKVGIKSGFCGDSSSDCSLSPVPIPSVQSEKCNGCVDCNLPTPPSTDSQNSTTRSGSAKSMLSTTV